MMRRRCPVHGISRKVAVVGARKHTRHQRPRALQVYRIEPRDSLRVRSKAERCQRAHGAASRTRLATSIIPTDAFAPVHPPGESGHQVATTPGHGPATRPAPAWPSCSTSPTASLQTATNPATRRGVQKAFAYGYSRLPPCNRQPDRSKSSRGVHAILARGEQLHYRLSDAESYDGCVERPSKRHRRIDPPMQMTYAKSLRDSMTWANRCFARLTVGSLLGSIINDVAAPPNTRSPV